MPGAPLAHVKWFTDPAPYPTDYSLLLSPQVLLAFAIALSVTAVAALIESRVPEPKAFRSLERFAPFARIALRLHVGAALLACAALGVVFAPSLRVERDALGMTILGAEALCGGLLLIGRGTRFAAVLLAALGVLAMQPFIFESILEQIHILGVAAFFFIVDQKAKVAPAAALTLLRVAMGFGIAYNALTEKLLDPGLAQALLAQRPELSVLRPLGVSDPSFVYLAGLTELVIGAVILSGKLTRPVMVIGAVLFTITLPVFGWWELLGHLAFYGIMLTLLIAPSGDSPRVRSALRRAA